MPGVFNHRSFPFSCYVSSIEHICVYIPFIIEPIDHSSGNHQTGVERSAAIGDNVKLLSHFQSVENSTSTFWIDLGWDGLNPF